MSKSEPRDIVASISDRLKRLARDRNEDAQQILTRYANERLLYRLSKSHLRGQFVLKGAMLFAVWTGEAHRPTQDIDFLGLGPSDTDALVSSITEICSEAVEEDGLVFDTSFISAQTIREDQAYNGIRIKFLAMLGKARIPLQIDIGFGDAITPGQKEAELPTLLNLPRPRLYVYPPETVIAEKFEAMIQIGITNSRLKDYFDIYYLTRVFDFDGLVLSKAIRATLDRRRTTLPSEGLPLGLTIEYAEYPGRSRQWEQLPHRIGANNIELPPLAETVANLADFFTPITEALREGKALRMSWNHMSLAWQ